MKPWARSSCSCCGGASTLWRPQTSTPCRTCWTSPLTRSYLSSPTSTPHGPSTSKQTARWGLLQYTVSDWVQWQRHFCLTLEWICSPQPQQADLFQGQIKLLLSSNPVYSCFIIHLHFFKSFLFTLTAHITICCFQYLGPSSPRNWMTPRHSEVNITWLIKQMKIRPSVNNSIAGDKLMNCWRINRTVLQLIGISLLTIKILCIDCIAFI